MRIHSSYLLDINFNTNTQNSPCGWSDKDGPENSSKTTVKSIRVAHFNIHHIELAAPDIWQPLTINFASVLQ